MLRDDLRSAARALLQQRSVTATAVSLLALTIGAVTAVFAIVHAVVLRPFPFVDQERLVMIWQRDDRRALPVIEVAHGEMEDWRARSRAFADLAVLSSVNWSLTLAGAAKPEPVELAAVSASFFPVVGTRPQAGRWLEPGDEAGPLPRAMVISHGLWMRRYGGDPAVVGRAVPVKLDADGDELAVEIAGVMPAGFDFPRGADVWVPAAPLIRKHSIPFGGPENAMRRLRVFFALGRLRPGASVDIATRELQQVMRTADRQGGPEPPQQIVVTPIADHLLGPAGPVLRTLLAGAVLMLLIACANVAGLHVSRAARRQRALAIRAALGASSRRLAGQIVLETLFVTIAALAGAVAVAAATLRVLMHLAPSGVPRLDGVALLDGRVLAFGAAATFVAVGLCALWPVLVASRIQAVSVLAHGAGAPADPRGRRVQRAVVVAQIAVALTLLAGTALFLRTVRGLDRTVLGFEPGNLLAVSLTPATDDLERWNAFYSEVESRVTALPHVRSAGAVLRRPLSGPVGWDNQPVFPGQDGPSEWGLNPHVNFEAVSPGYFDTMGIRLLRGRLFTGADDASAPGVVVVGESAARRLWPGRDPLGQRLHEPSYRAARPGPPTPWQTVIGVVADVRYRGLNDVRLDLYVPAAQTTNRVQHLMVRTDGDIAGRALPAIRAAARDVDPDVQVAEAAAMSEVVAAESAPWRFLMRVFMAFATLAACLATVGLAAVVALTVTARRRELAIRAALGADGGRLRRLVLREAGALVAAGVAAGLFGAWTLGRAVAHILIGTAPADVLALGTATAVAAAAGLLAIWGPARRAAATDPAEVLRTD